MEVKYFTPEIQANKWNFYIPSGQRTPGSRAPDTWVYLPEGVHTMQVGWRGIKGMVVRSRLITDTGAGHVILTVPGNSESLMMTQVAAPPGGAEVLFGTNSLTSSADITATSTVWAGVTIYIGANEAL